MSISYEGIGQYAVTCHSSEGVTVGAPVKFSANDTVAVCSAEDCIGGVVLSKSRDAAACAVLLSGIVTLPYSGSTAPAVGFAQLAADGKNGVKVAASGGRSYLVLAVDKSANQITFAL